MAKIKKVIENGGIQYPATITDAVKNPNNGKTVTEELSELGSKVGSVEISFNVVSNSVHESTDNLLLINGKKNETIEVELVVSGSNAPESAELIGINEDGSSFRLGFIGFGSKFYTTLTNDVKYLGLYFIATSDLKITLKAVLSLTKRVNDMTIEVDEIKSEVDEIGSEVKTIDGKSRMESIETEIVSKELFESILEISPLTTDKGVYINSDGLFYPDAESVLVIYEVSEGMTIRIEGDCVFQLQKTAGKPNVLPNDFVVGQKYIVCQKVADVEVPSGATRLMLSRKENASSKLFRTIRIINSINNEIESIVVSNSLSGDVVSKELAQDSTLISPNTTSSGYLLSDSGTAMPDLDSELVKYAIKGVEKITIQGACYFQYQTELSVPTRDNNSFLVSKPKIKGCNNLTNVPDGANYLIISKKKTEEVLVKSVNKTRNQYIDDIIGVTKIKFITGQYVTGYASIGDVVDTNVTPNAEIICGSVECEYGDVIYINGTGGNTGRLWAILDDANHLIIKSDANVTAEELKIVVPKNSAKILLNQVGTNGDCFLCKISRINTGSSDTESLVKPMSYAMSGELPNYFANMEISTGESSNINGLFGIYDALAIEFPDYVSKELFLTDSVGNECYMYHFRNSKTNVRNNEILVIAGTHGMEYTAQYHTARAFEEICRRWKDNESLASLRWNVDFAVVPCLNVYGHINKQRKNSRGVDLNRNYGEGWVFNEDTTSDNYAGTEAFSEIESKAVRDYVLANSGNLIFAVDFHYSGSYAYVATELKKRPLYMGWQRVATMYLNKLEHYDQISDDRNVVNVMFTRVNGDTSRWIDTIIPSVLLECPARLNLQENDKLITDNFDVSNLINLFLTAVGNARKVFVW